MQVKLSNFFLLFDYKCITMYNRILKLLLFYEIIIASSIHIYFSCKTLFNDDYNF